MSELCEGVVCKVSRQQLEQACTKAAPGLPFTLFELLPGVSIVDRQDSRKFSFLMEGLAAELSRSFGQSLLVRYDSCQGYRASIHYGGGAATNQFGPHDELYVPVDDSGNPITEAKRVRLCDLSPHEEYETIENAIQMGFSLLGAGDWESFKAFLGRC